METIGVPRFVSDGMDFTIDATLSCVHRRLYPGAS